MNSRPRKKLQVKLRKVREPRTVVVAFRLRRTEVKALSADLKETPAAGVKSLKQFARKIVIDFSKNRLRYVDPKYRTIDPDAQECLPEMRQALAESK